MDLGVRARPVVVVVVAVVILCVCESECVHACARAAYSFVINAKLFSVHFILRTFTTVRTRQVLSSVQQVIYFLANNLLTRYIFVEVLVTEVVSCNCAPTIVKDSKRKYKHLKKKRDLK